MSSTMIKTCDLYTMMIKETNMSFDGECHNSTDNGRNYWLLVAYLITDIIVGYYHAFILSKEIV